MVVKVQMIKSPLPAKKFRMIFYSGKDVLSHTDFGASGMADYTIHKDDKRKDLFLQRFHRLIETHSKDPTAPMTLSHQILWNKKSLADSFLAYKSRWGFH